MLWAPQLPPQWPQEGGFLDQQKGARPHPHRHWRHTRRKTNVLCAMVGAHVPCGGGQRWNVRPRGSHSTCSSLHPRQRPELGEGAAKGYCVLEGPSRAFGRVSQAQNPPESATHGPRDSVSPTGRPRGPPQAVKALELVKIGGARPPLPQGYTPGLMSTRPQPEWSQPAPEGRDPCWGNSLPVWGHYS